MKFFFHTFVDLDSVLYQRLTKNSHNNNISNIRNFSIDGRFFFTKLTNMAINRYNLYLLINDKFIVSFVSA